MGHSLNGGMMGLQRGGLGGVGRKWVEGRGVGGRKWKGGGGRERWKGGKGEEARKEEV